MSTVSLGSPAPSSGEEVLPCHGDFSACTDIVTISEYDVCF